MSLPISVKHDILPIVEGIRGYCEERGELVDAWIKAVRAAIEGSKPSERTAELWKTHLERVHNRVVHFDDSLNPLFLPTTVIPKRYEHSIEKPVDPPERPAFERRIEEISAAFKEWHPDYNEQVNAWTALVVKQYEGHEKGWHRQARNAVWLTDRNKLLRWNVIVAAEKVRTGERLPNPSELFSDHPMAPIANVPADVSLSSRSFLFLNLGRLLQATG
ncbi:hypothetical protein JCM10212_001830 [Sporobolomyces blumeae]